MEKVLKIPLSYFLGENGEENSSLSCITQRVDDASKLLMDDCVIELDNGVICSSRDELLIAISQAKSERKKDDGSYQSKAVANAGNDNDNKGIKTVVVVVFSLISSAIIWFFINSSYTRYVHDDSFTGYVAVSGLPIGYRFPVFIGLFAVCVLIGILIIRKRK